MLRGEILAEKTVNEYVNPSLQIIFVYKQVICQAKDKF